MRTRCNSNDPQKYRSYKGRGIVVCDRWQNSFDNFLVDMGERPVGMTLDRINNNGNYEPGNCRWATSMEQSKNKVSRHGRVPRLFLADIFRAPV